MSNDKEPLLGNSNGNKKDDKEYGSFAKKDGYSASPQGLASIVSEQQSGALEAFGGVDGLFEVIAPGNTLKDGLSSSTVQECKKYGTNALPLPPKPDLLELVIAALADPTMIMLLASAAVSLILGLGIERDFEKGWIEGVSISVTVCLVVSVAALTDYSKANEFREQQMQLEDGKHMNVIRGGSSTVAHPKDLVVGDVVRLSVGDIAPADGVLFQGSDDLKMDESALTGETELIAKQVFKAGGEKDTVDPFIVSGTNVMQGTGLFLVLAVGTNSIQGKILARIRQQEAEDDDESDEEEGEGGCMGAIKSFFTFGGGDQGAGLMEKLDILAMDIGKGGIIVAALVFLVMLTSWTYKDFIVNGKCSPLTEEEECIEVSGCGFSEGECSRQFGVEDVSTILDFFITAVTILVVAVPEGLPLAVTLALAVSMRRMMKDNNQVKHMDSTETMGSATTICSDKTGTLTENKMTTMRANYAGDLYEHVIGETELEDTLGSIMKEKGAKTRLLAEAVLLNVAPTAKVTLKDSGEAQYEGNPTDCALLKLTAQLDFEAEEVRASFRDGASMLDWGAHNIPFSSERKRMSWIVEKSSDSLPYSGKFRLYSKGAPQQVFDACSSVVTSINDKGVPETKKLSGDKKQSVMDLVSKWQDDGLRTLAIAYRDIKDKPRNGWASNGGDLESEMTLLAVVGIEDPLRATVPSAIEDCKKAGIDVRMCTGDALSTAIAIAKGCKILRQSDLDSSGNPKDGFAMTGAEFDDRVHKKDTGKSKIVRRVFDPKINDAVDRLAEPFLLDDSGNKVLNQRAFDDLWPTLRVLARCQPEDKLTLVRGMRKSRVFLDEARCADLYKEHGIRIFPDYQVVAVTGDGTNDAPALKSANVGFAMGVAGTETAKQACDIILLDDNFASIMKAVMWGRNVFDSISKFIQFQLTVNVVAITLAVIGAFSYSQSPLSAVQMLWVNMIMDSLASLALATEQPTKELLDRMPYGKRRPVISPIMIGNIAGHSIYQIAILCWVLFSPGTLPIDPPIELEPTQGSLHWSVFFNVFVMLQLFNEFNARRLPTAEKLRSTLSEWNVFEGVFRNPNFVVIMITTFSLQILMVQFGGAAVNVVSGGLTKSQWIFCVGAGVGGLVWQLVVNASVVLLNPIQYETKTSDNMIASAKKLTPDELEAATYEESANSKWDKVRLGVRRDILYARVFNTSVRSGAKIGKLVRCADTSRRGDEYYNLLARQMSRRSLVSKKSTGS